MTDDERDALLMAMAKATANQRLQLEQFASGVREDLQQIFGALLTMQPKQLVPPAAHAAPKPEERPPTGRHELIGGVVVEVPESTQRQASNTLTALRWIATVVLAGGGWLIHLWKVLHP